MEKSSKFFDVDMRSMHPAGHAGSHQDLVQTQVCALYVE
jgi:hypothetical protein